MAQGVELYCPGKQWQAWLASSASSKLCNLSGQSIRILLTPQMHGLLLLSAEPQDFGGSCFCTDPVAFFGLSKLYEAEA